MTAISITHHVGRKLATAIDYGSPQSIEISEIGAVMHQMSCERLSLSLFSRFACLLARLKTCVLLIN
ncbi:CCC_1a_G0039150.mRNA.1.CDS.1 [Saccharomyces cerevisiae]|nr:CCC_1a_G0039150.mRNA.1.CDS.1 [Saccharomyces cerevisiae]CAI7417525.1 CCC_1a_G0039150.mRNA.1.CDS.1 [Saccharomyces cerevisiae]